MIVIYEVWGRGYFVWKLLTFFLDWTSAVKRRKKSEPLLTQKSVRWWEAPVGGRSRTDTLGLLVIRAWLGRTVCDVEVATEWWRQKQDPSQSRACKPNAQCWRVENVVAYLFGSHCCMGSTAPRCTKRILVKWWLCITHSASLRSQLRFFGE